MRSFRWQVICVFTTTVVLGVVLIILSLRCHLTNKSARTKFVGRLANLQQRVQKIHENRKITKENSDLYFKRKDIDRDILNIGHQKECDDVTVLIMVTSNVKNGGRRETIRETLLNQSLWSHYLEERKVKIKALFLVGVDTDGGQRSFRDELMDESRTHGDVLLMDLTESFYSLSYKLMIGFQWVDEICSYRYLLKSDDDIAINLHSLFEFLAESPSRNFYAGNLQSAVESAVIRAGRYGISRREWPQDNFPDYHSGGCFLITGDVITKIIPFFEWQFPLKIDDAYIGSLVAKSNANLATSSLFQMSSNGSCAFNSSLVAMHIDGNEKRKCKQIYNEKSLKLATNYLSDQIV